MTSVVHHCTREFVRFGLQLRHRLWRTLGKPTQTNDVDPHTTWEEHFEPFCQVATASGAEWTCDGHGDWYLLKPYRAPLEPAVDELLELLGMPGRLMIGELQEQIVTTITARNLAAFFRLGMPLPMERLKRTHDAERCHGDKTRGGCAECQRREAEHPYCDKRRDDTDRQRCALDRVLNRFTDSEFHGGPSQVGLFGDNQNTREVSPHLSEGGDA